MFGKWAKYKAMETCFGDEVRILYWKQCTKG
jgi:hypothetical protein